MLQGLLNETTPADGQRIPAERITAEMPVLELNGLLELAPALEPDDEAVVPRFRIDIIAAVASVTFTLAILLWLAVRTGSV